ncbi:alpha/beta fold hydrolase [Nocardia tengchongensis]|uniref:alpha/beta fold hydrolase n=1 Tax=Nocardia tengchongensis TaxID=2055889 RepID=UPI00366930FB
MSEDTPEVPSWVPRDSYPSEHRYINLAGARVHYVDESVGPPLLLLRGNPTWSFLYHELITNLRGQFRCIALDYPGFGLSHPGPGYGFTPAEHAAVVERFVTELNLSGVTLMVQDWGGPIGFAVATRHPDRFSAFVIGNTWAWPKSDPGAHLSPTSHGHPRGRGPLHPGRLARADHRRDPGMGGATRRGLTPGAPWPPDWRSAAPGQWQGHSRAVS